MNCPQAVTALTTIQSSMLRQLLEAAPAFFLSELEEMVIFDAGATQALLYNEKDFVGPIRPINKRLAGIGAGLDVVGYGIIRWKFRDEKGKPFIVEVEGYYVPEGRVKLLSPQQFSRETNGGRLTMDKEGTTYEGVERRTVSFIG